MTIDQFIRKWAPPDMGAIQEFQNDLFSTYKGKEFQKVALEVLTYPKDSVLRIESHEEDVSILYYPIGTDPNEKAMIYLTSRAVGITEADWLWVLEGLAQDFINQQKQ